MKRKLLSILALLCLTVASAWAQDPEWLKPGDTWDDETRTLTVNSSTSKLSYKGRTEIQHLIISPGVKSIGECSFERYEAHQRTAKRVSVKSTIVGNHLYSTARGWTWEQLIDDGKALLAIDDEQPDRIISTDKKAEKAGGLCLALAGVLVKPTDDVDPEKEYQLIALQE